MTIEETLLKAAMTPVKALGNGNYAAFDGTAVILTHDGTPERPGETIILEPESLINLMLWLDNIADQIQAK